MSVILQTKDISKRFGGVQALTDVSFSVEEDDVFAIIGPNGAGKTTLLNIACGLVSSETGTVALKGSDVTGFPSWRIARAGMARTLQAPVVFPRLSVRENVMLGHFARRQVSFAAALFGLGGAGGWKRDAGGKADEVMELVGLQPSASRPASELPLGMQRLVEIARAFVSEPAIVVLDEPAAGLSASEVDRLAEVLRGARERGVAICLVEHNMRLVMGVANKILVLRNGVRLFEGAPAEVQQHPEVIEAYLGSPHKGDT